MYTFLLIAFFAGIVLVIVNELAVDRPKEIEYRYLPRELDDYIRTAPLATNVFGAMFDDRDVL